MMRTTRRVRWLVTMRVWMVAVVLLGGGVVSAVTPSAASAAEIALTVGPALLDLTATPGASGHHELTVANTGGDPLHASVAVEPVAGLDEEHSAVPWLSVSPAEVRLDSGTEQQVAVAIDVPDGLASGGRYAKVTITTTAPEIDGNAAAVAGQVGVGVLVTVEGDGELTRAVEIAQFAPVLEVDGRIGFRTLLHNDGNVHLLPRGEIAVRPADGDTLGALDLKQSTPHLPGTTTLLAAHGSLPLAPDTTYEADLTVSYEDGGETHHAEATSSFSLDPALTIASATLCENLDRGPTLRVALRNDGTIGLEPTVLLAVQTASGQPVGSVIVPGTPVAWPQETTEFVTDLPQRLESGAYVLAIDATFGAGETLTQQMPFQLGGLDGAPIPLCEAGAATPLRA